ncbi:hypothetical protein FDENT_5199 [Fusarium denticulatum]|uniref:Uncharacterized protein n=1 Tax=Fusarium denticulatum TaxID=48507 RepID=A0A8H5UCD6_9HYPO|nr:hypothetical protein FDENT_5199 [Fusarium denticulatum]
MPPRPASKHTADSTNMPFMFHMRKVEPRLVSELKPVGVVNLEGELIGVRFQNFMGDDVDVMAQSETIPNARIFQGAKDGFRLAVDAFLSDGLMMMHHCIHCLEHSAWWVPSDALESDDVVPYGCSLTICALRGKDGSKECDECDDNNSWEPLQNKHVRLLETFHLHQLCDWESDAAYLNDSFIVDLRHKINHALANHRPALITTTDHSDRDLSNESLQVQRDIRNSVRGILEALQHRGSSCTISTDSEDEG